MGGVPLCDSQRGQGHRDSIFQGPAGLLCEPTTPRRIPLSMNLSSVDCPLTLALSRRACHYPHLLRARISSADADPRKPRSGGLFIAPAAPSSFLCFLFFGGADVRHERIKLRSRAAEKQKTDGRLGQTTYKLANPTGFEPSALGRLNRRYLSTLSTVVGNDKPKGEREARANLRHLCNARFDDRLTVVLALPLGSLGEGRGGEFSNGLVKKRDGPSGTSNPFRFDRRYSVCLAGA